MIVDAYVILPSSTYSLSSNIFPLPFLFAHRCLSAVDLEYGFFFRRFYFFFGSSDFKSECDCAEVRSVTQHFVSLFRVDEEGRVTRVKE